MKRLVHFLGAFLLSASLMAQTNSYKWLELKNVDTTTFTNSSGRFWYNSTVNKFSFVENGVVHHLGSGTGGSTAWGSLTGIPTDISTIAGLTPSNDDFLQRKSGAWTNRTIAQVKADLAFIGGSTGSTDKAILGANGSGGLTAQSLQATIDAAGNLNLGTSGLSGSSRTITPDGSGSNINLFLYAKGTGNVSIGNNASSFVGMLNSNLAFSSTGIANSFQNNFLISGSEGTVNGWDMTIRGGSGSTGGGAHNGGNTIILPGPGAGGGTAGVVKLLGSSTNGYVITAVGTDGTISWAAPSGGFTNPMTTLGDIIYEDATPVAARLAGNTTTTKKFFTQTGNGTISAVPGWNTIVSGDVPNNAANTSGTAANLSGTPALPNGTTATTQSTGDNTTNISTTAFTTTAINNAIASVNPAVAVQAASAAALPNSPTYSNGVGGIGATLTSGTNSVLIVDGYTPALNERILVKNQASAFQNGVYLISQLGVGSVTPWILTRALDYNQPSDMNNTGMIPVINGTVNALTSWAQSSHVTTVGTDAVTFVQFTFQKLAGLSVVGNSTNATASVGALTSTGPNQLMYSASDGLTIGWHERADAFIGTINTITSADYSVQATDRWNTVQMTSSSSQTVTFTTSSGVAVGDKVLLIRSGSAAYSYVAGAGVTFTPAGGTLGTGLDAGLGVYHVATYMGSNVWNINNGQPVSISSGDVTGALGFTPGKPVDFIIQSSSNTLASNTSAQAIFNVSGATGGAFTAVASTTYRFRCILDITNLSASAAIVSFGFGGTATLTSIGFGGITQRQSTLSTGAAPNYMVYSTSASAVAITTSTTTTSIYTTLEGVIRVNGAGTIIPQLTMGSASASVVQPNSGFWIQDIGTNTIVKQGNWN